MLSQGRRVPKSRSLPACIPCRRRKSRCNLEAAAQECLMCRMHQTECVKAPRASTQIIPSRQQQGRGVFDTGAASPLANTATAISAPPSRTGGLGSNAGESASHEDDSANAADLAGLSGALQSERPESAATVSLDTTEEDNPHIVGPATAGDNGFLEDYLLSIQARPSGGRVIRPVLPGVTSAPVVFMSVKKRPVGLTNDTSPSSAKLQVITKLLEPHLDVLMQLYSRKGNKCFPILNEDFFVEHTKQSRASAAVIACIYAHSMCYWRYDPLLQHYRRPDVRFIWNLALEALYSELHLSPGMPSVIAILLNIGGRPTTTMVGNGMLLGSAISLAHSLGLNRNPVPWGISQQEKAFRINIWWCLVIHDRWTSLTHGTPPHIRQSHYDVPMSVEHEADERMHLFETLAGLSSVLGQYLESLYCIGDVIPGSGSSNRLSFGLDTWADTLSGHTRRIIIRGTDLEVPGAANLRLCYLAAKFFAYRLELGVDMDTISAGQPLDERVVATRRAVEEIVILVHELSPWQLGDFWLPTTAFVFSSAITFLARLAVQTDFPACQTPSQSLSLSLANDLITSLRSHKKLHDWELGDVCLAQYGDVIDKLWTRVETTEIDMTWLDSAPSIPDPVFWNSMVEDQWDTFASSQ